MTVLNFEAIGTSWQIDIYHDLSLEIELRVRALIQERIEIFDKNYSRFRSDSLVTVMAKEKGEYILPDDASELFALYHDLYIRTNGLFTPLVGNILSDAGYDAVYSLQQKNKLQKAPIWDDIMEYRHPTLTIKNPALLDFGAAGKGYLVDLIAKVLEGNGISKYCIDGSGDILYKNDSPIRIGLENPENTGEVLGVYTLTKGSICGSAHNRRRWGNFSHIINPQTLMTPQDIIAVWVIASRAIIADALATCLFFVDPTILTGAYDFEYVIVYKDHSVKTSVHFSGELFLN